MGRGTAVISAASASAPVVTPPAVNGGVDREEHWRNYDSPVNAVSFGFVATAILISLFLIMAIFERFLRPRSPHASSGGGGRNPTGGEASMSKLDHPSPKMTIYPGGVSVLMPGERTPTFLAHPAPAACPPECVSNAILHNDAISSPASS